MTTKNLLVRGGADFSGMKKEMEKTQKTISNFQSDISKTFTKIGGILAGAFAVKKIYDYGKASVQTFNAVGVEAAKLARVMQNTMGATEGQIHSVKELMKAQEGIGVIAWDTQMAGAQELGTYMSNVESLKTLIPTMNDMLAQQYGVEATNEQAVNIGTMIGKVMDGQLGALSRYGYSWDEAQEKVLKFGSELERANMLAEVIGQSVGGMNAELAKTPAGMLKQLEFTFAGIREEIGKGLTPVIMSVLPYIQKLANWLAKLASYFSAFMQALFGVKSAQTQVGAAMGGAAVSTEDYGDATEGAGKKAKKAAKEAKGSLAGFDEINSLADKADAAGDSSGGSGAGGGGGAGVDMPNFDMPEIDTETIPAKIQEMADKIKSIFKDMWGGLKDTGSLFADAFSGIGPALQPIRDAVGPIKQSFSEIGGTLAQLLDEFLKPAASYILFDFIPSIVTGFVEDFAPVFADAAVWGMDLFARTFQNVTDETIGLWNDTWLPSLEKIKVAWLEANSSVANSLQSLLDGTIKPLTDYMLKSFIIPISAQLVRTFTPIFTDILVFALELFAKTFKNLTDTLNNLTSTVILPALEKIKNAFMDMVPRIGSALQSLLDGTIKPFIDYIINDFVIPIASAIVETLVPIFTDILVFAFEETARTFEWLAKMMNDIYKTVIKPVFDLIKKIVTDTLKIVMDLWNKHGKELLKNLSDLMKNIRDLAQQLWDKVLKPIIEPFLEMLTWLWDKHLKGLIKETVDFVLKLVNAALDILNKFIKPIISYLVDKLSPVFVTAFKLVSDVVGTAVGFISDLISGLLKILGGLIDFVVGVFTGNWGKAWDGVVSVFEGIVKVISGIFKGVLNLTIDVINAALDLVISGINRTIQGAIDLINAVPGINIDISPIPVPRIPKLARGGIVDGATNFGNYIAGEAGAEMIVPLENTPFVDKLAGALGSAVMAAMQMSNSGNMQQSGQGRDVVLNLDGTTLARILMPYLTQEEKRIGTPIIKPI